MIKKLFSKNKVSRADVKAKVEAEQTVKALADSFINKNNIEVVVAGVKTRVPALKWLYPGYGDYRDQAIMANDQDKIATEIINHSQFVTDFLHNKRDIDGLFGYFVSRVEGNYVQMADKGNRLFSSVKESDVDDYDTLVMIKQCNRLFPKFNKETFKIDFKHIEIFGEVFNKLKSKLSYNYNNLPKEQLEIMMIDIPTYTHSSVKIENSVESYNIFKLSELLEKISVDIHAVTSKHFLSVIDDNIRGVDKVKDSLYGSESSARFHRSIENLEKISEQLGEIKRFYKQMLDSNAAKASKVS